MSSCRLLILILMPLCQALAQTPLSSAFTYQGLLKEAGLPASGLYDLQACLFDGLVTAVPIACASEAADVPVENGVFTAALDFGSTPFVGQQRFLELRVRPGASSGSYTVLTPRQLITAAPEAVRAARSDAAPWLGLSGVPAGFADGVDDVGAGTVTAVATGAGLTGGPITGSGTLSLALGGVQSVHIAPGAVALAQINSSQVQARISGSCELGTYLQGINADGSVSCADLPGIANVTTLVDSVLTEGEYSSIVVGNDGIPMISYTEFNAGGFFHSLKLARCANPSCTGVAATYTIDAPAASVGTYNSMAIGADGLPVISYYDATARALKVAHCGTPDCSSGITRTTVDDPANDVGRHSSLAIGIDGRPVISYRDQSSFALKVAKCANVMCTGSATISTVDDPTNRVGEYTSITVGSDGLPIISYYDSSAFRLKVAKCSNSSCSAASVVFVPYSGNNVGQYSSIALDASGYALISYYDATAGHLEVSKCTTLNCSNSTRATVDAAANNVGAHSSIKRLPDGIPVISYYDATARALKVARCANANCDGTATVTTVDASANDVGQATAIAVGIDGYPVISYRDVTAGALKLVKCGSRTCR